MLLILRVKKCTYISLYIAQTFFSVLAVEHQFFDCLQGLKLGAQSIRDSLTCGYMKRQLLRSIPGLLQCRRHVSLHFGQFHRLHGFLLS